MTSPSLAGDADGHGWPRSCTDASRALWGHPATLDAGVANYPGRWSHPASCVLLPAPAVSDRLRGYTRRLTTHTGGHVVKRAPCLLVAPFLVVLAARSADAQTSPFVPEPHVRALVNEISGDRAYEHERHLTRFHK